MDKENIYELTLDDLPDSQREIAEVIGIDNLLKLSDNFAGNPLYIQQRKKLEKEMVYRRIFREFNGGNVMELTQRYGVSKTTVYEIVKEKREELAKKRKQEKYNLPGQISLMDLLR
ncbi:MAG: hypothetical protein HFI60_08565 [Lachnospiraceae bacterium]|jgi:Mor family transcriptional regulator|nr:hypothetical protein [Lachnospiraceae bacterium]